LSELRVKEIQNKFARPWSADDEAVGNLLWGPASALLGSKLADEQIWQAASEAFPGRRVCIARHWMLIDITLANQDSHLIDAHGVQPMVLYANTLVEPDDARERPMGFLSGFKGRLEDCFFETDGTIYVLAGRGARKHASVRCVEALARRCGTELIDL
jgi:hypothetical protein